MKSIRNDREQFLGVPLAPTGIGLSRNSRAWLDKFWDLVGGNSPRRNEKTMFVPIVLLSNLARALKSAAAQALGPDGNHTERSGVEFIMRRVGELHNR